MTAMTFLRILPRFPFEARETAAALSAALFSMLDAVAASGRGGVAPTLVRFRLSFSAASVQRLAPAT